VERMRDIDTCIYKHKDKTYNLRTKRRIGKSRPRPMRWGKVPVLDQSLTGPYLDYLYRSEKDEINRREKVDKFCGYISEPQIPPRKYNLRCNPQQISQALPESKYPAYGNSSSYPLQNPSLISSVQGWSSANANISFDANSNSARPLHEGYSNSALRRPQPHSSPKCLYHNANYQDVILAHQHVPASPSSN